MTYQETSDIYHDPVWRSRSEMCIREQAFAFTSDEMADVAALANAVISSNWVDIESVMAAVISTEFKDATVTDDEVLKSTVIGVWPIVARARYPGLVDVPSAGLYGKTPKAVVNRAPILTPLS